MTGAQPDQTPCPCCGIRPSLSGEPNCYCDPYLYPDDDHGDDQ